MTAPFNPEELCDQTLIGSIRMLMKDDSVFPEIFSAAFENRNANNLVFSIPSDLSITGKQIDVIADRAHLLKSHSTGLTNGMHGLMSYRPDWILNRPLTVKPESAIIGWSN